MDAIYLDLSLNTERLTLHKRLKMAVIRNLRLQWQIKTANMNQINVMQSRIVQLCTAKYCKVAQACVSQKFKGIGCQRVCTYDIIKIKI